MYTGYIHKALLKIKFKKKIIIKKKKKSIKFTKEIPGMVPNT